MPKAPVGTSTQKRDTEKDGEKKGFSSPTREHSALELKSDCDGDQDLELIQKNEIDEERDSEFGDCPEDTTTASIDSAASTAEQDRSVKNGSLVTNSEKVVESPQKAVASMRDVDDVADVADDNGDALKSNEQDDDTIKVKSFELDEERIHEDFLKLEMETNLQKQEAEVALKLEMETNLQKKEAEAALKLEMEANLRKQETERLAMESFARGDKLFFYPQVVKPDLDVEIFLNRSLSTLSNEPDVLIMGAFNDWRWKSFTVRLSKTHLSGDWWSCLIHIPKEAYKMDFVFFNGQNVYDNNDKKDFSIPVEGAMDPIAFEDFLLEEKRRELEKLAKEEAERERKAEEQRRIEAEKAASEADRAQARVEVEKRREALQQLIKKAAKSVDNAWYIEPSEFKGDDMVRLYYNRSSGPLAHANELWIHGGHNNWKDGLTIAERLEKSERKDGDWWYVKGTCL